MQSLYSRFIKPILFRLDPEHAHELTVEMGLWASQFALTRSIFSSFQLKESEQAPFDWKGLHFPNRVGLAAGFDKNATMIPLMKMLGFGFLELGSITAQSSNGNAKPRLFRLPKDEAIINRMGLNNDGADCITNRIKLLNEDFPIGINIAKTHSPKILGDLAIQDYVYSFIKAEPVADYITLNISCPNTEEGKTFEDKETLKTLLSAIKNVRKTSKPVLIKLSVDLGKSLLKELVELSLNFGIDGFVCSNTSAKRLQLISPKYDVEVIGRGGLSGKPIFEKSIERVKWVREFAPNSLVIGVGGIFCGNDAKKYIEAGADLVQVYSGLIYKGSTLIKEINQTLKKVYF